MSLDDNFQHQVWNIWILIWCSYDSQRPLRISIFTKNAVCSFLRPKVNTLSFDIMNVEGQSNSFDCGVYAIAFATHLANGLDPVPFRWDSKNMRKHLLTCLINGKLVPFPTLGKRKTRLRCIKTLSENIHCLCRMPNNSQPMIKCDDCHCWYHMSCVSVGEVTNDDYWFSASCTNFKNSLK